MSDVRTVAESCKKLVDEKPPSGEYHGVWFGQSLKFQGSDGYIYHATTRKSCRNAELVRVRVLSGEIEVIS